MWFTGQLCYESANILCIGGITAPGFECPILQARCNNTPFFVSLPVYLFIQTLSAHIKINVLILLSFDFQCLPYASLKIMCDCVDN